VVEHSPHHILVEGLNPGTDAGTEETKVKIKKSLKLKFYNYIVCLF
jgi:hypothetical protein